MQSLKKLFVGTALIATLFLGSANAFAQQIGTVNADKIISNYSKAQDIESELKVKEAEIQKFIAEAQKKIKDAATPVEKNNLEKELSQEFKTRQSEYRKMQIQESEKINNDIIEAIQNIAEQKGIDMVLAKGAVFLGGVEITDEVLNLLNNK